MKEVEQFITSFHIHGAKNLIQQSKRINPEVVLEGIVWCEYLLSPEVVKEQLREVEQTNTYSIPHIFAYVHLKENVPDIVIYKGIRIYNNETQQIYENKLEQVIGETIQKIE